MFPADTHIRLALHDDHVAVLRRDALPPATAVPPRRPRVRRSLGRSLVVLGTRLAGEVRVQPSRSY